mmetsp:Transcript_28597/g.71156  ORF Transcript_28597/g.71156 Transcript_28597/m.71156 type:complete len:775 (-) Transcript_28597:2653-4977(-)
MRRRADLRQLLAFAALLPRTPRARGRTGAPRHGSCGGSREEERRSRLAAAVAAGLAPRLVGQPAGAARRLWRRRPPRHAARALSRAQLRLLLHLRSRPADDRHRRAGEQVAARRPLPWRAGRQLLELGTALSTPLQRGRRVPHRAGQILPAAAWLLPPSGRRLDWVHVRHLALPFPALRLPPLCRARLRGPLRRSVLHARAPRGFARSLVTHLWHWLGRVPRGADWPDGGGLHHLPLRFRHGVASSAWRGVGSAALAPLLSVRQERAGSAQRAALVCAPADRDHLEAPRAVGDGLRRAVGRMWRVRRPRALLGQPLLAARLPVARLRVGVGGVGPCGNDLLAFAVVHLRWRAAQHGSARCLHRRVGDILLPAARVPQAPRRGRRQLLAAWLLLAHRERHACRPRDAAAGGRRAGAAVPRQLRGARGHGLRDLHQPAVGRAPADRLLRAAAGRGARRAVRWRTRLRGSRVHCLRQRAQPAAMRLRRRRAADARRVPALHRPLGARAPLRAHPLRLAAGGRARLAARRHLAVRRARLLDRRSRAALPQAGGRPPATRRLTRAAERPRTGVAPPPATCRHAPPPPRRLHPRRHAVAPALRHILRLERHRRNQPARPHAPLPLASLRRAQPRVRHRQAHLHAPPHRPVPPLEPPRVARRCRVTQLPRERRGAAHRLRRPPWPPRVARHRRARLSPLPPPHGRRRRVHPRGGLAVPRAEHVHPPPASRLLAAGAASPRRAPRHCGRRVPVARRPGAAPRAQPRRGERGLRPRARARDPA